jgi:hypothetical protein
MRLVDAITRVEPTWVEAVAVVQAVCAQLDQGQAAPPLDALMISASGTVSFPPAGPGDDVTAIAGVGQLLAAVLRTGDCPMPLWESMELARRSPRSAGTARGFGSSLTCFPPAQGRTELAKYFEAARRLAPLSERPATAPFSLSGLTLRASVIALVVALCGVGTGVTMGVVLASRAPRSDAPARDQSVERTVAHLPPFVS